LTFCGHFASTKEHLDPMTKILNAAVRRKLVDYLH
jgi:hypothetical protein